jgi:hypothetical protein
MESKNSGCSFVLFGSCLLMGCATLVMLVWGFLRLDWRVNNRYLQGSCVVLDKRLADSDGRFPNVGHEGTPPKISYHPEIKIRYEVGGRTYEVWTYDAIAMFDTDKDRMQAIVDSFQVGATYPCWYDPDRPEKGILVRGHAWMPYFLLVVPVVFLTIGGAGIRHGWKNRGRTA